MSDSRDTEKEVIQRVEGIRTEKKLERKRMSIGLGLVLSNRKWT